MKLNLNEVNEVKIELSKFGPSGCAFENDSNLLRIYCLDWDVDSDKGRN